MAHAGDSMTQIADDELMRIQKTGEALAGLKDKKVVDARQAVMLTQLDKEMTGRREALDKQAKLERKRDKLEHAAKEAEEGPGKRRKGHSMCILSTTP